MYYIVISELNLQMEYIKILNQNLADQTYTSNLEEFYIHDNKL